MKNNIILFMLMFFIAACTPMDDKYKDFVDDGPIVYLSKLDVNTVKVTGERNRVMFQWPAMSDPRGKTVVIYWANKTEKLEKEINPAQETSFFIPQLNEGSYIFDVFLTDKDGNSSIPISLTGNSYGAIYESYLINRRVSASSLSGTDRLVACAEVVDTTMIGVEFKWFDGDNTEFSGFVSAEELTVTLEDCQSLSFMYRTQFSPEGGVDIFYAPWEYYVENVKSNDVGFDMETNTFSFPIPDDANWTGYEISWSNRGTNQEFTQIITEAETVISDYNGREFNYAALFSIDGKPFVSSSNTIKTAVYIDLDRSDWYAAPETDLDGNPIPNVNFGGSVADKLKSPYLSHLLPWNNGAGQPNASSGDAVNSPSAHFDDNSMTYLSMVKGIGTDATSGDAHSNGGVTFSAVGEKPWFIIRLDETQPQTFNYFRMRYRENGSNGSGLKPQGVTFFGSNDDACITDVSKWTQINSTVIVPPGSTAGSTQPSAANMGIYYPGANLESGNVMLPAIFEYRYVKMQYDKWETGSNTMQIGEFWLGLYD